MLLFLKKNVVVSPFPEPVKTTDIASSSLNTTVTTPVTAPVTTQLPQVVHVPQVKQEQEQEQQKPFAPETKPATIRSVAPTTIQETVNKDPVTTPIAKETKVVTENIEKEKSNDDQKELKLALDKIKQLEQQLAEAQKENVRSRSNGRKLAATVQPLDAVHQHLAALEKPHPTEGYPPQVVLGVAALVFIFTYLFF